jgi:hypothetical protein
MYNPLQNPRALRFFFAASAAMLAVIWVLADQYIADSKSFTGVVVDKYASSTWSRRGLTRSSRQKRYLVVQTDDGQKLTVRVGASAFGLIQKGDRVVKVKGERYPRRENVEGRATTLDEFVNQRPPPAQP